MKAAAPPVARARRRKNPQYLRRHKAARIAALLKERAGIDKAGANLDRKLGRSSSKAEAAFKGCKL